MNQRDANKHKEYKVMDSAQASEPYKYPAATPINCVKDLADFLNAKIKQYPRYADNELHVEYSPDQYRLAMTIKVTDDEFIISIDTAESDPFEHEDQV